MKDTWFDDLIEAIAFACGENGNVQFRHKQVKGIDYILTAYDEHELYPSSVYVIDDRIMFKQKVQNLVGDECKDPTADDVQEAAWEVLERYKLVSFND